MLRVYSQRVLNLKEDERAVVANGRVLGPLEESEDFSTEDFSLLERFSFATYGEKIKTALERCTECQDGNKHFKNEKRFLSSLPCFAEMSSNTFLRIISLLVSRPQTRNRFEIGFHGDEFSVLKLEPTDPDRPVFDIAGIVDPVSRGAQKLGHVLQVLQGVLNCKIRVFLNSVEKNSDMPLKRFDAHLPPENQI